MSVSQRKDGRWLVKYKDPVSGKWLQKAFRDEALARTFNEDMSYEKIQNKRLTVRECVLLYVDSKPKGLELSARTIKAYNFLVNGYDRKDGSHTEGPAEFLADKYCDELDKRDLINFRQALQERGQNIGCINMNVGRINAAMNWAADEDLLEFNCWAKYKALKGHRQKHRDGKFEDFEKIYVELPPWMQWACRTCLALALRPGESELGSLKWSAFDWQGRLVTVYMPKVDRTKTVFPRDDYLAEAKERYLKAQEIGQIYVCPSGTGRILTLYSFRSAWKKACAIAGVKMPPYAMRHIAASMMLYTGADMASLSEQLGHKDATTTAAFYTHASVEGQRRAAQGIPLVRLVQLGAESGNKSKQ